jgi:predicted nucleic acid-binding protein
VLLASKRRGLIPLIRPSLDRLVEQSFFLSPQLYAELLDVAGEARS